MHTANNGGVTGRNPKFRGVRVGWCLNSFKLYIDLRQTAGAKGSEMVQMLQGLIEPDKYGELAEAFRSRGYKTTFRGGQLQVDDRPSISDR